MILETPDMYLCDYLIKDILDYKFHRGRDFVSSTTHGVYVFNSCWMNKWFCVGKFANEYKGLKGK